MTSLFPFLPVFLDLTGRAVVLLNGDAPAADLARRFLDAGAGVTVVSPEPVPDMQALTPSVRLLERRWRAADLTGAALVVAPQTDRRRAKAAARVARALFLAIDDPALSDIHLGSAVAKGPLAFGVTTAGASPVIGDVIARRLEAAVPPAYRGFLEAAARAAQIAGAELVDAASRDAFWRATAEAAFDIASEAPETDWDLWIARRFTHV